jgi:hypothetical protein
MPEGLSTPAVPHDAEESGAVETTLYDLMMAMYDTLAPGEEDLVVPTVVYMLRQGHITLQRDLQAYDN